MQYITRKGTFDSGHRVMNERMKCFNIHGHTYLYELTFRFQEMEDIGYALDFKEIKRVGCQWIDDALDHGMILNPKDDAVIEAAKKTKSKVWLMSLAGDEYCNPSVENLAREVFLAQQILFENYPMLRMWQLRLYETPNCYTDCYEESIPDVDKDLFYTKRYEAITKYATDKGIVEYDDRKECPTTLDDEGMPDETAPEVETAPKSNLPAHHVPLDPNIKHSGNSTLNSGISDPPKSADRHHPAPADKPKPKGNWDFGTKWI